MQTQQIDKILEPYDYLICFSIETTHDSAHYSHPYSNPQGKRKAEDSKEDSKEEQTTQDQQVFNQKMIEEAAADENFPKIIEIDW